MTNINLPSSHQSESNQGLSVTGIADSPQVRPNLSVNTDQRAIINVPDSAEIEGSEGYPIIIYSVTESVAEPIILPRHARPRKDVGSPKLFGDRRFIDVMLERDETETTLPTQPNFYDKPRAIFVISSPSDLLTPLAEAPPVRTLVAETLSQKL